MSLSVIEDETVQRKKFSLNEYLENIDALLIKTNKVIETHEKSSNKLSGVRDLKGIRKGLQNLKDKAPRLTKIKKTVKRKVNEDGTRKLTFFEKKVKISEELAKFLDIEDGIPLSRIDVIRAITAYIHIKPDEKRERVLEWSYLNKEGRNLQSPENGTIILPDETLSKLLRYDNFKQRVKNGKEYHTVKLESGEKESQLLTDDRLRYTTVQRLIGIHLSSPIN